MNVLRITMLRSQSIAWLLALCLGVVCLDQLTKFWILQHLNGSGANFIQIIPRFFQLVVVWNHGVSFGMFNNSGANQWILVIISLLVIMALLYWFTKTQQSNLLAAISIALIVGGAFGNIIDRLYHGAVLDFLLFYWRQYHYPAFNIADSAICVGAFLLFCSSFQHSDS